MSSSVKNSEKSDKKTCLICKEAVARNALISHIADHINYKKHKCTICLFKSVLVETMMDHQNDTGHKVLIDGTKNWYMERICQLIYLDFDYAEQNSEDAIRSFGSNYADRKRLLELLKAEEIKEEQEIIFLDSGLETEGDGMESSRQRVRVRLSDASNGSTTSNKPICGGEEKTNPWWRRESKCVEKRKQINHQPERRSSSADVELDPNPGSSRQMASTKRAQNAEHRDSSRSHQKQQSTGPVVVDTHLQQLMTSYRDDIIRKPHSQRRRNHIQTAPADSSTQDSQQSQLDELTRQITKGIEKRKCKLCIQCVPNDYPTQKLHVIEFHMPNVPPPDRLIHYIPVLVQCFMEPGTIFITNDLQCNVCGQEIKTRAGRVGHVATAHASFKWDCIFDDCDYIVTNFSNFVNHLNCFHEKRSTDLKEQARDRYKNLRADFDLKITPLVRKCFPFDLTVGGKPMDDNALIDETPCNFMPVREIPQLLAPRKPAKIPQRDSDSSDTDEDVKPEEPPSQPKKMRTSHSPTPRARDESRTRDRDHARNSAGAGTSGGSTHYHHRNVEVRPFTRRSHHSNSNRY